MPIYQLPQNNEKNSFLSFEKEKTTNYSNLLAFLAVLFVGIFLGVFAVQAYPSLNRSNNLPAVVSATNYSPQTSHEEAVINVVKNASDSVVSVVISKEVPVYKKIEGDSDLYDPFGFFESTPKYEQNGTEEQEVGQGTGFFVSEDGMILTNKHVAYDLEADYTIVTNNGKEYKARILSRDPVQDLAILKIDSTEKFKPLPLGNSSSIRIGQTAIAIGNALGEFQNTVSVGVISGLGRTITASGGETSETLEDIIQTDTAINKGNSGGPLLNLRGEVIGINTAVSAVGQGLGFAITIDKAKRDIEQTKATGKISYPFLGIRYVLLDDKVAKLKKVSINYGALILSGSSGEKAITKNSPAEKGGLQEGDIVLEINNEKITTANSLSKIISKYKPNDKISMKIQRGNLQSVKVITLGEWDNK
ncbi:trypsin-like peptidase domain-containing protein [bacterium]|nr:trypsin-like peptidase domain-containing protein [bacterium]